MRVTLATLCVLLLAVGGCAKVRATPPDDFQGGQSAHSLDIGGVARQYRLYLPAGLPADAPLVVMLHGGFGSAEQAESTYGWDQLADTAKFAVAYPDGLGRAWNTGGGCCGRSGRDGVDDIGFISAVVADISTHVGIDRGRVFATGISNGGMLAYSLACNTDIFAAIGPDSATQLDPCSSPRPTSVIHIHGTADTRIRYDGEPGAGITDIDGPSVPQLNSYWREVDRCGEPVTTTAGAVTTLAADCADGRGVTLVTVDGGGHEWPPFATAAVWSFFAG